MTDGTAAWNKCSVCKTPIGFGVKYYKCSVSTCNTTRFQLQFCSVDCWDAHLPVQRHRSAHASEVVAPKS